MNASCQVPWNVSDIRIAAPRRATAVRVNRPRPKQTVLKPARRSSRRNGLHVHQHAHLAAEQIEQDRDAIAIRHSIVKSKAVGKDAFKYTDLLSDPEIRPVLQLDEARVILALPQCRHDLAGNG